MNFRRLFLEDPRKMWLDAVLIVVPLAALYLAGPLFIPNQSLFMVLAIYIMLAESLNIVYGFTGYLPFGFGVFFAVGAYGTAILIHDYAWSVSLSIIAGACFAALLSILFTPMLRLSGAYFAISSLAAFEAVYYIFSNDQPQIVAVTGGPYGINFSQVYNANLDFTITAILSIVAALIVLLINRTTFGIALKAIREDRFAVELAGVSSLRYRTYAWLITAFLSGIAGGLYGWYLGFFYPEAVFNLADFSVLVIVFVLAGGKGTVFGPLIGTVVLFLAYELISLSFPNLLLIIFGAILVALVLFLPDGFEPIVRKYLRVLFPKPGGE